MKLPRNLIKAVREDLRDAGISSAKTDVFYLLGYASGLNMTDIILNPQKLEKTINYCLLRECVNRRINCEPISKIIERKDFWDLSFFVNSNVLDPRPETELLVNEVLRNSKNNGERILDLGTGSGCIAISVASKLSKAQVIGSDISREALEVAEYNNLVNLTSVRFVESDWFAKIEGTFDIIVSNPPYLSEPEYTVVSRDIKLFEPKIALVASQDGLECYRKIANQLNKFLTDEGIAFFEVGFRQCYTVAKIFHENGFDLFGTRKDISGINRVLCVKKAS